MKKIRTSFSQFVREKVIQGVSKLWPEPTNVPIDNLMSEVSDYTGVVEYQEETRIESGLPSGNFYNQGPMGYGAPPVGPGTEPYVSYLSNKTLNTATGVDGIYTGDPTITPSISLESIDYTGFGVTFAIGQASQYKFTNGSQLDVAASPGKHTLIKVAGLASDVSYTSDSWSSNSADHLEFIYETTSSNSFKLYIQRNNTIVSLEESFNHFSDSYGRLLAVHFLLNADGTGEFRVDNSKINFNIEHIVTSSGGNYNMPDSGVLGAKISGMTPYFTSPLFGMTGPISRITNIAVNDNKDEENLGHTGLPPFICGVPCSPIRKAEAVTNPDWEFPSLVHASTGGWSSFSETSPLVTYGLSAVMDNQTFDTRGVAVSALNKDLDIHLSQQSILNRLNGANVETQIEALNFKAYNAATFNNSDLAIKIHDTTNTWATDWTVFPGLYTDPEIDSHVTFFNKTQSGATDTFEIEDFKQDLVIKLRAQQGTGNAAEIEAGDPLSGAVGQLVLVNEFSNQTVNDNIIESTIGLDLTTADTLQFDPGASGDGLYTFNHSASRYVEIPADVFSMESFTIQLCLKRVNTFTENHVIILDGSDTLSASIQRNTGSTGFNISCTLNEWRMTSVIYNFASDQEINDLFPQDVWTHMTIAKPSGGHMMIYLNGEQLNPTMGRSLFPVLPDLPINYDTVMNKPIRLGSSQTDPTSQPFPGIIDTLRIYNGVNAPETSDCGPPIPTPTTSAIVPTPTPPSDPAPCLVDARVRGLGQFISTNGGFAIYGFPDYATGQQWVDLLNTPHATRSGYSQDVIVDSETIWCELNNWKLYNGSYNGLASYISVDSWSKASRQYDRDGDGAAHSNDSIIEIVDCMLPTPTPTPTSTFTACHSTSVVSTSAYAIGDEYEVNGAAAGSAFNGNLSGTGGADAWYAYDPVNQVYTTTGTMGQSFPNPHIITKYRIYPWNHADRMNDPVDWTFEASDDNFTTTVTLDTQNGAEFYLHEGWRDFNLNNITAYSQYRLNITANRTDPTYLVIQELEFIGCDEINTATATPTPTPTLTATPTNTMTASPAPPSACEVDIKYEWLLDDGVTYETRYDKISPYTKLNSLSDGPTVHTAAETPVSVATYYHNNGGRVEFEVDADKNVTAVKMYNQSNNLKQYESTGPFDQYSAYLDLNFDSTYYLPAGGYGYAIDFQYGDIYQVRYTNNVSAAVAKRWFFNQTQIKDVKILSGGAEHSTSLQTISKTITPGTPDTAQVTAEILIPDQFICDPSAPAPIEDACEVDIKYEWLLDDGIEYETRYDKISPYTDTPQFSDGPTVHTAAEIPVILQKDHGYPRLLNGSFLSNGHSYIFDANRNVTNLIVHNRYGAAYDYNLANMDGPYDQYSPYLDLNFATTHYMNPGNPQGHVVSFQNGDIHRIYWSRTSDSQSSLLTYIFNQTQIKDVKILTGGVEHSTSLQTISKTITPGTPDTAQVTAEIRIPSHFVCDPPTACGDAAYYSVDSVNPSTYTVTDLPIEHVQASIPVGAYTGWHGSAPAAPSSYYVQYIAGSWRYTQFNYKMDSEQSLPHQVQNPFDYELLNGEHIYKFYIDVVSGNQNAYGRWRLKSNQTLVTDPTNLEVSIETWTSDQPVKWKQNWVVHPTSSDVRIVYYADSTLAAGQSSAWTNMTRATDEDGNHNPC